MSDISKYFAALSPEQQNEFLRCLREDKQKNNASAKILPQTEENAVFPLSFGQQQLWFLDQLMPFLSFYNVSQSFHLSGQLSIYILHHCFITLVERHKILRTTFAYHDGQPVQVISCNSRLELPLIDLQSLESDNQRKELERLATEERECPFDLQRGPLLRVTLLRLAPQEHMLLLTQHHCMTDNWSQVLLQQEIKQLYEAFSAGQPSPLAPLAIQYADYAAWQRQWLQGKIREEHLTYWRTQLQNLPTMSLPIDYPRPEVQSFRGRQLPFTISAPLTEQLRTLSRREGVTLFMSLLTVFQLMLALYTGQQDIVVGTVMTNRTRRELEEVIGFLTNTVVIRTDLSGNPTLREILARVRQIVLEATIHQDLPFEKLIEDLQPERKLSQQPLFQVMITFEHANDRSLQIGAMKMTPIDIGMPQTSKVDLTLMFRDTGTHLRGVLEYATDLFMEETMQRLIGHFQVGLTALVTDPDQRLSQLSLLTGAERQQVLVTWNATQQPPSGEQCIHELFEVQVKQTPDAIVLVYEEHQLSYAQLNQRANQLAHYLQGRGVGPEQRVGLCLERSLEMVIALLAILKAGAAYVPLDPGYPQQRLVFLLQDAQISLLLTQQYLLPRLPHPLTLPLLCLDTDWSLIRSQRRDNLLIPLSPDHLAYVIYTSGSTGQPKGVMVAHRGVCNCLLWMQHTYALTPNDRVLQKTPYSFDVSVCEFFWPLLTGARLVLARPEGHRDSAYLVTCIGEQQITTLHFVPSLLRLFLEEEGLEQCGSLQRVICSGEALPLASQQRFFERLSAELHNLYGPTEASIEVSFWACQRDSERASVPIGFPIANMQLYVLDPCLEPVPVGVAGELYIGGIGLARGYLHQAKLTAEKFIPNPWTQTPGTRLYRTGDQVRRLANGAIEFLGRLDHQVKVRGVRIELGEIEAVLRGSGLVQDVVVVAPGETAADKRLVAYIVPRALQPCISDANDLLQTQSTDQHVSALRNTLKNHLPEYMIPSTFILLKNLPLSPNGKVDRQALPMPDTSWSEREKDFAAPRTSVEEILIDIWSNVLGHKPISIYDNFFEIGGDSILSIQIVNKAHKAGLSLTPKHLFQYQTVAELAGVLSTISLNDKELQSPTICQTLEIGSSSTTSDFSAARTSRGTLEEIIKRIGQMNNGKDK